jgi:hypothetical protein
MVEHSDDSRNCMISLWDKERGHPPRQPIPGIPVYIDITHWLFSCAGCKLSDSAAVIYHEGMRVFFRPSLMARFYTESPAKLPFPRKAMPCTHLSAPLFVIPAPQVQPSAGPRAGCTQRRAGIRAHRYAVARIWLSWFLPMAFPGRPGAYRITSYRRAGVPAFAGTTNNLLT